MAMERVEFVVEGLYCYLSFLNNKVELYESILAYKNNRLENIKDLSKLELNRLIIDRDESNYVTLALSKNLRLKEISKMLELYIDLFQTWMFTLVTL